MSTHKRKLFLCGIGLVAGLAAWPVAEIMLMFQVHFPSYLVFSIALGIIFGIIMGGFFGSGDGIISNHKAHIKSGITKGLAVGAAGGIIGFLVGQAALFLIGEYLIHSTTRFNTIGLPISRALGWACLGIFIGMIEGIRSRSLNKIRVGIIGGISGGILGGLALEYLRLIIPSIVFARLIGLLLFGLLIGFLYGLVEARMSFGILTLLNGKYKGKEFIVSQHRITIGSSDNNDIVLEGYRNVDSKHALINVRREDVSIKPRSRNNIVYANDDRIGDHMLKLEDVIRIGSAKLLYHYY
jgi:hypothetical protein